MKHHSSMPPKNLYFIFNFLEDIVTRASWQQLKLTTSLLYLSKEHCSLLQRKLILHCSVTHSQSFPA